MAGPPSLLRGVRLGVAERETVAALAGELASADGELAQASLLEQAATLARRLPRRVSDQLAGFGADGGQAGCFLVSGLPIAEARDLPTPPGFGDLPPAARTRRVECLLVLVGSLLGTPYCFASQQRGHLVLDVFPVAGCEDDQLGCASTARLEWHTEDAFHELRADHSLLLCIRNQQRVATRYVPASALRLPAEVAAILRQPRFAILPDVSHTLQYNASTTGVLGGAEGVFAELDAMVANPARVPVLAGADADPLVRVDFAFMPAELHDDAANLALAALRLALEDAARSVALAPGDLLIIDNHRCVHGRDSFQARFDGTDRWLKRLNVVRDGTRLTRRRVAPAAAAVA